ncbi:helix-turn-helix domain-containing protein [Carnobacterium divergens]|uniref:helix-turn-helix domain-containing protein n=1 Tax=Carnobacterium divergens TaxID=2748 RepID=UPI0039B0A8B0
MIDISLKDVMAENNKSITDIHNATGISRNTLGLLANGVSKGIQFDTLEKIINYLDCDIEDILEVRFNNQDLLVELQNFDEQSSTIKISNEDGYSITLFSVFSEENNLFSIEVTTDENNTQQKLHTAFNFLSSLSRYKLEILAIEISNQIHSSYQEKISSTEFEYISFNWEFSILLDKLNYGYFWNIPFVKEPLFDVIANKYRNENLKKI